MVFEPLPKAGWVSRLRSPEGWDMKKFKQKVNVLCHAQAYQTSMREIFPDGFPELDYLGWIGSMQFPLELRQEIVDVQGYNCTADNVLLTHGTALSNFMVIVQSLRPGDEAIRTTPTWFQFKDVLAAMGINAKVIQRKEEDGWHFDIEDLKEAITPKTKIFMTESINNPTGATLSNDEMKAICEICEDHNVRYLSDEIYRGLEYGGPAFSSPSAVNLSDTAISTASLSKTIALDGVQVGWMATHDKEFMDKCYQLERQIILHVSTPGVLIATAALEKKRFSSLIEGKRKIGRENWKVASDWIKNSDVFSGVVPPESAFLSMPKYNLNISAKEFSEKLFDPPYKTVVEPGPEHEYHLRLGVGYGKSDEIKRGLEQVDRFVADLKKKGVKPLK